MNTKIRSDTFAFCNLKLIQFQHEVYPDGPIGQQNPLNSVMHTYHSQQYIHLKRSEKQRKGLPSQEEDRQHRIETTADEEVAMVFSSSNLILCPPFSTETQVKKIPHSHKIQQQQLPVKK